MKLYLFIFLIAISNHSFAYIGPGMGFGAIIAVILFIVSILREVILEISFIIKFVPKSKFCSNFKELFSTLNYKEMH